MAVDRQDDLRYDMISILLAFGADATRQTPAGKDASAGGRTPLHRALLQPDPIVLLMLLEGQFWQESLVGTVFRAIRGKGVKQIEDDAGRTALHMAASRPSDIDTLSLLITYGFSVDGKDDKGNTPLMFAAQNFSDADNFLYLLDQATNPCGSSKAGATVEAALRKNAELSQVGADDATGMTLSPLAELKQRCP
jgi:ankyrin repeat protein